MEYTNYVLNLFSSDLEHFKISTDRELKDVLTMSTVLRPDVTLLFLVLIGP